MTERVATLQTQIKTADLQQEATQLRQDLAATRQSMDVPKSRLSFRFVTDTGISDRTVSLPIKDGIVHVKFTVVNDTDTTALEGAV